MFSPPINNADVKISVGIGIAVVIALGAAFSQGKIA